MKFINYSFFNKKKKNKEKGLILNDGDVIHILVKNKIDSEIIIFCKNDRLTITSSQFLNKKKDNLKK